MARAVRSIMMHYTAELAATPTLSVSLFEYNLCNIQQIRWQIQKDVFIKQGSGPQT